MKCPNCGHDTDWSVEYLAGSLVERNAKLLAELDEARRMLNRQAEEYAAYGIQPPKDILDWLASHPKDGVK